MNAISHPESFDQYVSQNQSKFDNDFYTCLEKKISDLKARSEKKKDACDEKHGTYTDDWNRCHNEVEVSEDNAIKILSVVGEVAKGKFRWDQSQIGTSFIYLKSSDPAGYNEVVNLFQQLPAEELSCQLCTTRRCFLC